jgi:hypothetical protein
MEEKFFGNSERLRILRRDCGKAALLRIFPCGRGKAVLYYGFVIAACSHNNLISAAASRRKGRKT